MNNPEPSPASPSDFSGWLSDELWALIQKSVPILCVDAVLTCNNQVGLTLRTTPFDSEPLWCHVGGRVNYNETFTDAMNRHLDQTLVGVHDYHLSEDAQPVYSMQWFSDPMFYRKSPIFGHDPRQHAVSLVFHIPVLDIEQISSGSGPEAQDFRWVSFAELDSVSLWPGSERLITSVLKRVV